MVRFSFRGFKDLNESMKLKKNYMWLVCAVIDVFVEVFFVVWFGC